MNILDREFVPAKLYTAGGDVTKNWYVYYAVLNPETGQMHPCKKRGKINYIKNARERTREGNFLVRYINQRLSEGKLSPFKSREPQPCLIQLLQIETEVKKNSVRWRTYQSYTYSVNLLGSWLKKNGLANIDASEFTRQHAHRFCDYMLTEKKYNGTTFNNRKKDMNIFFNAFMDKEIITSNPFKKIKNRPQERGGTNIPFTDLEKEVLSKELKQRNPRLYLFTQFIYFCYIRPIEILRLTVDNFNLKEKKIIIYSGHAKNRKQEAVFIPDSFMPLVESMEIEKYPSNYYVFGAKLLTSEKSYSRNRVTQLHTRFLRELKIPVNRTMYSWKSSGCVSAYKQGIDIYAIMRQCRHASINQTMTYLKSLGLYPNVEFASKMR